MNHNKPLNASAFTVNPGGGKKHTAGKPTTFQVPETFVVALSAHMTIGAVKYGFKNWFKGLLYSQVLESIRRHYGKLRIGQDIDAETGSHHLLAVAANAMMGWVLLQLGKLTDDRKDVFVDFEEG